MTAEFVRERITQLRLQKGVSEYKMSYDLGHSRGYINNISSGKSMPSMLEFFAICEYFDITPIEFFNKSISDPKLMKQAILGLEKLSTDDLDLVHRTIERLARDN
ncbi:MAG: helix-turn-helix domain-containing protein [Faecalibacterium sp.]|nr:helix-turn-helix domain-containing protein [Ruminococcus sp.]MCM1392573.1 helix-turn-helix domain-containing protein [Ruminococcus sp.]MCM1485775.1 helix-turn-helix domain-containing protein [Faecalibacterium sp.]